MKKNITIKDVANYDPITFDKNCVNFIRNAAKKYNYTYKDIVSGAGHDACAINKTHINNTIISSI